MKKNFYAVKAGRRTGIFTTWEDCQAQTDGFPGARFKGFVSLEEARGFLGDATAEPYPAVMAAKNVAPADNNIATGNTSAAKTASRGSAVGKAKPAAPGSKENTLFTTENRDAALRELLAAAKTDYIAFTDGSCLRNPDGPGGYAAVVICCADGTRKAYHGGHPRTTNNRMELTAAMVALESIPSGATVELYTDSQYLKNAYTKRWLYSWKRNNWVKHDGNPVLNKDLWISLDELFHKHKITFQWVKGHNGNYFNEVCDTLAQQEARSF